MMIKMKRLIGILLSLVLVLGLMSGLSLTAYAARTEEVKNDFIGYGIGSPASFIYSGFDVFGVDGINTICTTYLDGGYITVMKVKDKQEETFHPFAFNDDFGSNGVKVSVKAELIGQAVLVTYSLTNTTNTAKTVNIGSYADVQIGEDGDKAPVSFIQNGIQMEYGSKTFALVSNSDKFDTKWIGSYFDKPGEKVFTDGTTDALTGEDSALAYSWTVNLDANETQTRSCAFAVGDVSFKELSFDPNGGQGTMDKMTILIVGNNDPKIKLSPNKFTRPGFDFAGWSKTQNGEKEYDDGEQITGSATEDITLYAVWREAAYSYSTENAEHTIGDGKDVVLTVKGEPDDSKTYDNFDGVEMDGTTVSLDNYTTAKGSLILTLKSSYLDTLSVGDHTVTIKFNDGGTATAALKITAAATPTVAPTTAPAPTPKPVPKTGDGSNPALWLSLAVAGLILIAGTVILWDRKKRCGK